MTSRGLKYEGQPCINGHGCLRYVNGKACVECAKAATRTISARRRARRRALAEAQVRGTLQV